MLQIGEKIANKGVVTELIGGGGEGNTYKIKLVNGKNAVLKLFYSDKFDNSETEQRIKFLMKQGLHRESSIFKAPTEFVRHNDEVGYISGYAFGTTLEQYINSSRGSLADNLVIAIVFAFGLTLLHCKGIGHGDVHLNNFLVDNFKKVRRLYFVDLDNYNSRGVSPPKMLGHILFIAPELRSGLANGLPAIPDLYTDRYSAGLLLQELLLRRRRDADDNSLLTDEILDGETRQLLNLSLSEIREKRPEMSRWLKTLQNALGRSYQCDVCGGEFILDVTKIRCPLCRKRFAVLKLVIKGCDDIILDKGTTIIGRAELRSDCVSVRHCVFHRVGPELWINSCGTNGTFRWSNAGWKRLPDNERRLIQVGDKLRFADVEAIVARV